MHHVERSLSFSLEGDPDAKVNPPTVVDAVRAHSDRPVVVVKQATKAAWNASNHSSPLWKRKQLSRNLLNLSTHTTGTAAPRPLVQPNKDSQRHNFARNGENSGPVAPAERRLYQGISKPIPLGNLPRLSEPTRVALAPFLRKQQGGQQAVKRTQSGLVQASAALQQHPASAIPEAAAVPSPFPATPVSEFRAAEIAFTSGYITASRGSASSPACPSPWDDEVVYQDAEEEASFMSPNDSPFQVQHTFTAGFSASMGQNLGMHEAFEQLRTAGQGLHPDPPLALAQQQHPREPAASSRLQGTTTGWIQSSDDSAGGSGGLLDQGTSKWAVSSAAVLPSTPMYGGLCFASPEPGLTPPECRQMMQVLEGAAQGSDNESADLLFPTFEAWLVHMGLEAPPAQPPPTHHSIASHGFGRVAATPLHATPSRPVHPVGLASAQRVELRALWLRAKEARNLQVLVETMKESELEMAQREAEETAQYLDALALENSMLQTALHAALQAASQPAPALDHTLVQPSIAAAAAPVHATTAPVPNARILRTGSALPPAAERKRHRWNDVPASAEPCPSVPAQLPSASPQERSSMLPQYVQESAEPLPDARPRRRQQWTIPGHDTAAVEAAATVTFPELADADAEDPSGNPKRRRWVMLTDLPTFSSPANSADRGTTATRQQQSVEHPLGSADQPASQSSHEQESSTFVLQSKPDSSNNVQAHTIGCLEATTSIMPSQMPESQGLESCISPVDLKQQQQPSAAAPPCFPPPAPQQRQRWGETVHADFSAAPACTPTSISTNAAAQEPPFSLISDLHQSPLQTISSQGSGFHNPAAMTTGGDSASTPVFQGYACRPGTMEEGRNGILPLAFGAGEPLRHDSPSLPASLLAVHQDPCASVFGNHEPASVLSFDRYPEEVNTFAELCGGSIMQVGQSQSPPAVAVTPQTQNHLRSELGLAHATAVLTPAVSSCSFALAVAGMSYSQGSDSPGSVNFKGAPEWQLPAGIAGGLTPAPFVGVAAARVGGWGFGGEEEALDTTVAVSPLCSDLYNQPTPRSPDRGLDRDAVWSPFVVSAVGIETAAHMHDAPAGIVPLGMPCSEQHESPIAAPSRVLVFAGLTQRNEDTAAAQILTPGMTPAAVGNQSLPLFGAECVAAAVSARKVPPGSASEVETADSAYLSPGQQDSKATGAGCAGTPLYHHSQASFTTSTTPVLHPFNSLYIQPAASAMFESHTAPTGPHTTPLAAHLPSLSNSPAHLSGSDTAGSLLLSSSRGSMPGDVCLSTPLPSFDYSLTEPNFQTPQQAFLTPATAFGSCGSNFATARSCLPSTTAGVPLFRIPYSAGHMGGASFAVSALNFLSPTLPAPLHPLSSSIYEYPIHNAQTRLFTTPVLNAGQDRLCSEPSPSVSQPAAAAYIDPQVSSVLGLQPSPCFAPLQQRQQRFGVLESSCLDSPPTPVFNGLSWLSQRPTTVTAPAIELAVPGSNPQALLGTSSTAGSAAAAATTTLPFSLFPAAGARSQFVSYAVSFDNAYEAFMLTPAPQPSSWPREDAHSSEPHMVMVQEQQDELLTASYASVQGQVVQTRAPEMPPPAAAAAAESSRQAEHLCNDDLIAPDHGPGLDLHSQFSEMTLPIETSTCETLLDASQHAPSDAQGQCGRLDNLQTALHSSVAKSGPNIATHGAEPLQISSGSSTSAAAQDTLTTEVQLTNNRQLQAPVSSSLATIPSLEWSQSALGTIKDCIRALSSPSLSPASTPAKSPAVCTSAAQRYSQLRASAGEVSLAAIAAVADPAADAAAMCGASVAVLSRISYGMLQPISITPFSTLFAAAAVQPSVFLPLLPFSPSMFSEPTVCKPTAGPAQALASAPVSHDVRADAEISGSNPTQSQPASITAASITLTLIQHPTGSQTQETNPAADFMTSGVDTTVSSTAAPEIPCTPVPEQPISGPSATTAVTFRSVHTQVTPPVAALLVITASPNNLINFTPPPPTGYAAASLCNLIDFTPPANHAAAAAAAAAAIASDSQDPFHLKPACEVSSYDDDVPVRVHSNLIASCILDHAVPYSILASALATTPSPAFDFTEAFVPMSLTHGFTGEITPMSMRDSVYEGITTPESCVMSPLRGSIYDGVTITPSSPASTIRNSVYDGISFDSPITGLRSLGGHTPAFNLPDALSPSPATAARYPPTSRHATAGLPHPRPMTNFLNSNEAGHNQPDFSLAHAHPNKAAFELWSPSRCSLLGGNAYTQGGTHTLNSPLGSSPGSAGKGNSPQGQQQQRVTLCVAAGDGHASRRVRTSQDMLLDMHGSPTAAKAKSCDPQSHAFSRVALMSETTALTHDRHVEQHHEAAASRSILAQLSNSTQLAASTQQQVPSKLEPDVEDVSGTEKTQKLSDTLRPLMSLGEATAADLLCASRATAAHAIQLIADQHAALQAVNSNADLQGLQPSEEAVQSEPAPRLSQLLGLWGSSSLGSLKPVLAGRNATRIATSQPTPQHGSVVKQTTAPAASQSRTQNHAQSSSANVKPRMWPAPSLRSRIPRPPSHRPVQQQEVLPAASVVQEAHQLQLQQQLAIMPFPQPNEFQPQRESMPAQSQLESGLSSAFSGLAVGVDMMSISQLVGTQGNRTSGLDMGERSPCAVLRSSSSHSHSQVTQTTPGLERGSGKTGAAADMLGLSADGMKSFTFDHAGVGSSKASLTFKENISPHPNTERQRVTGRCSPTVTGATRTMGANSSSTHPTQLSAAAPPLPDCPDVHSEDGQGSSGSDSGSDEEVVGRAAYARQLGRGGLRGGGGAQAVRRYMWASHRRMSAEEEAEVLRKASALHIRVSPYFRCKTRAKSRVSAAASKVTASHT